MLSEHLQAQDFKTGSFIANGYVSNKFGFDQGWDHYTNYIRESKSTEARNVFKEAGEWITQHKDERFFAYIQTIDPHVPYRPSDEYLRMYDARTNYDGQVKPGITADLLAGAKANPPTVTFTASDRRRLEGLHNGEISEHDHYFGKFLAQLDALGLKENTLVVVTSDHGEEFGDHDKWGHGHSVYQELLHVPLMFRLPGQIPAGMRVSDVVSTQGIAATVTQFLGVPTMPTSEERSLAGFMLGNPPIGPRVAMSDYQENRRVLTTGRWKFILRGNLTSTMFDLKNDPGEKRELNSGHTIPRRFARIMLGQFLGAGNRAAWLGSGRGQNQGQGQSVGLEIEDTTLDPETCRQLVALGYFPNVEACMGSQGGGHTH